MPGKTRPPLEGMFPSRLTDYEHHRAVGVPSESLRRLAQRRHLDDVGGVSGARRRPRRVLGSRRTSPFPILEIVHAQIVEDDVAGASSEDPHVSDANRARLALDENRGVKLSPRGRRSRGGTHHGWYLPAALGIVAPAVHGGGFTLVHL